MVIPSGIGCGSVAPDTLPGECKLTAQNLDRTKRIPAQCKTTGWLCSSCSKVAHSDSDLMSTTAITDILYEEGSVDPDAGGQLALLTLCRQSIGYDATGNRTRVWTPLPTHNRAVSYRADELALSMKFEENPAAVRGAAALADNEGGCCEGLKLGDECIPLIVFILLWLLMAALLALLVFVYHRTRMEIEMERNNTMISEFAVDKELEDFAAMPGDDDDDI
eukprot:Hpha_TRINITY_DN15697_c1_g2::TRINITY_DN15697_c1_g2_i2::g.98875::m.98875